MEQYCLQIVLNMTIPFTINEGSTLEQAKISVVEQLAEALESLEIEDIQIIEQKTTKC